MGQAGIVYDYGDGVDAEDAADLPRIPNTELTMKIAVIWVTFIWEELPFTSNWDIQNRNWYSTVPLPKSKLNRI